MGFIDYLVEASEKHGVLAYGRMNPPTAGHEQVINKVHEVAKEHNATHKVVLSHQTGNADNPLSPSQKVKHAKRAFPKTNIAAATKDKPTILHHASEMHKTGVHHLHVVAGSDRTAAFHKLLNTYNGKTGAHGHYNFKSITVHSSGARDPDAEGTAGVSGTKMRQHAAAGKKSEFHAGLPKGMKPEHKEALYHDLRHSMGVHEIYDPHLKISEFQWGELKGTNHMKKITPGEKPNTKGDKLKETNMQLNKIPALFMNEAQRQQLREQNSQLEFDGIQTQHFNMCPTAYKMFKQMIETIRAGKHIGEVAGHVPLQAVNQNSDAVRQVQAGIAVKPEGLRQMQFRQYTGL